MITLKFQTKTYVNHNIQYTQLQIQKDMRGHLYTLF